MAGLKELGVGLVGGAILGGWIGYSIGEPGNPDAGVTRDNAGIPTLIDKTGGTPDGYTLRLATPDIIDAVPEDGANLATTERDLERVLFLSGCDTKPPALIKVNQIPVFSIGVKQFPPNSESPVPSPRAADCMRNIAPLPAN